MRRALLTALLTLLVLWQATAQQGSGIRPDWADGYFRELQGSYIEVATGNGTDYSLARGKAINNIVAKRNLASGGRYKVQMAGERSNVNTNEELTVKARILDEYAEHRRDGDWVVYLLVQTCKNPQNDYDAVSVTDRTPMTWRTFVPGMVQLDREQKGKTIAMIGGEVAMIGGIIAFEGARASYSNKVDNTHNAKQKASYIDNMNICADIRNICIAGAVAIYAWNIIDALVAKGPRKVYLGDAELNVMPYASPDGGGLAMRLTF